MNAAIIPARGGSARIPRKNVRMFHGKPIVAYSIDAAKKSGLFDRVVVSTEDEEIADIANSYGADVIMRPRHLADDESVGTQEVTAHALRPIPCEYACCIYATAPLLLPEDLAWTYRALVRKEYRYVYAAGWFYWGRAESFTAHPALDDSALCVVIGNGRWIDINTEEDWQRAEQMYAALHPEVVAA